MLRTQWLRLALITATALSGSSAWADEASAPAASVASEQQSLEQQFLDPPSNARPRVWWHWMNGNVTKDGIAKDLEWMRRIGIGGVTNFDAAMGTPQIVDRRLVYMSPEWKEAFRFAVGRAKELGLEFGIAASPGFSETGGPWVTPEAAMKKLVWSDTLITGGKKFDGVLPTPPSVAGPFQTVRQPADGQFHAPDFYRDTHVLAYRVVSGNTLPTPASVLANGKSIDGAALIDDDLSTGLPVPSAQTADSGSVVYIFAKPHTIRSARVFIANLPKNDLAGPYKPAIESSQDGRTWARIATLRLSAVPTTVSFAPTTARYFRLVLTRGDGPDYSSFTMAPGVDIAVMMGSGALSNAAPMLTDFELSAQARVNAAEQKAGFALANDYYALDEGETKDIQGISPSSVIDISDKMTANGRLRWMPPPGRWKVQRLGYSLVGKTNHPAPPEATGLEVDKFDAAAVADYTRTYLGTYRRAVGPELFGPGGVSYILNDSTEAGAANWTPDIISQFRQQRGYDPTPWLPGLTGEIIGSRTDTDRFLYDYRATLAVLTARDHYGVVARIAHETGLKVYGESLAGGRSISSLGDDLDMRRYADTPMAEMWSYNLGKGPAPAFVADMRGAASVAHFYGRPYAAAEALTSILMPWASSPADLRPMIDTVFLSGINRPFIHTSVHQPLDDKIPGLTLQGFGQHFTRHDTWAELARPWMDYIARSSFLLQQGHNRADVAWIYGEEAPIGVQASKRYPTDVPVDYAYDFVSAASVLEGLAVDNGDLVSSGGARYKVLYLGGTSRMMTLPLLRTLASLAEAGATIVGDAPIDTPSLADDRTQFAKLTAQLWSGKPFTAVGRGQVIAGHDIDKALASRGIAPAFHVSAAQPDTQVGFVERTLDDGAIYFLSNRKAREERIEARFRGNSKAPEIWHADSGTSEPAPYRIEGDETVVPITFSPLESTFVVFRKPAASLSRDIRPRAFEEAGPITGPWTISFQAKRGAPASMTMATLIPLNETNDPRIKYFSGIAAYVNQFEPPHDWKPGQPLWVNLGEVREIAQVFVNGQAVGYAWQAPFRLDVSSVVRRGINKLEVRVANLWVNRLIGDAQAGAQKVTWTAIPTYRPDAPLKRSGLIGPVRLERSARVKS